MYRPRVASAKVLGIGHLWDRRAGAMPPIQYQPCQNSVNRVYQSPCDGVLAQCLAQPLGATLEQPLGHVRQKPQTSRWVPEPMTRSWRASWRAASGNGSGGPIATTITATGCGSTSSGTMSWMDLQVGVERAQAAGRIIAVGGVARHLIDAGGYDYDTGISEGRHSRHRGAWRGVSAEPYCMSVATALARARLRLPGTISRTLARDAAALAITEPTGTDADDAEPHEPSLWSQSLVRA